MIRADDLSEELLEQIEPGSPLVREERVAEARARLDDGDQPSAAQVAASVVSDHIDTWVR